MCSFSLSDEDRKQYLQRLFTHLEESQLEIPESNDSTAASGEPFLISEDDASDAEYGDYGIEFDLNNDSDFEPANDYQSEKATANVAGGEDDGMYDSDGNENPKS